MSGPSPGARADAVTLRAFQPAHLMLLARWLREPHVARWYRYPQDDLVFASDPPDGASQAIVVSGGAEVGYVRWQRVDRATLDALGLTEIPSNAVDADILLGEAAIGRGVGPAALVALAAELRRDPTVPMIGLTTELENTRAQRAFEKAGFRVARQYDAPRLGRCHLMLLDLRPAATGDATERPGRTGRRRPAGRD
jgi:aminoglycoside 6'-N-acetyltransferase